MTHRIFSFKQLKWIISVFNWKIENSKCKSHTILDSPFPGIIREVWKDTPGEGISSLVANPDYPNNPTTIEIIENFDAPFNVEKDYGSKLKGYFVAPETGNNTFYLSCSKACELYFSTDEDTRNKTKIISLKKPTWHNQWNK